VVAVNALFIRGPGALAAVSFGSVLVLLRVVFCLSGSAHGDKGTSLPMYHGQIGRAHPCHNTYIYRCTRLAISSPVHVSDSKSEQHSSPETPLSKTRKVPQWAENSIHVFFETFTSTQAPSTHFPLSLATLLVHVHPCACCTPRPSVARRANRKQRHQRRVCSKTVVLLPRPKRTCRARTRLPRP